jgi:hypothetical protein
MFGEPRQSGIREPSFYYVVLAATCFQRTACGCHPNAGGVLCDTGYKYLAKADRGSANHKYPNFYLRGSNAQAPKLRGGGNG